MRPSRIARLGATTALAALGLAFAGAASAQPAPDNLPRFQTTWQEAIKPNAGFWSPGVAQEFAYTAGPSGVTSVAPPSTNLIANVRQIYGAAGEMTYLEIIDGLRNVTFVRANGDTFTSIGGRATYARASDWTRQAIVGDPLAMGWRYQNFAAWQTGLGMPNGSMGATSFGLETGWNGSTTVPQTGTATFTGLMGGIYNDSIGQDRAVTADVGIAMNFADHTADFYTVNTRDRNGAVLDDLNITGSFVGLPNFPQMFGSLKSARLQGTSSARFFGPAGEEFGGVFTLTPISGEGLERLAGAFGSKVGSPIPAGSAPFTNWANGALSSGVLVISGKAMGLSYDSTGALGVTSGIDNAGDATTVLLTRSNGPITGLEFSNRLGVTSLTAAAGDYFTHPTFSGAYEYVTNDYAPSQTSSRHAIFATARDLGWEYQSYGAWETMTPNGPAYRGEASAVSVGASTPGSGLPTGGGATFKGKAGGVYAASYGERALVTADVNFIADFAARSATFATGTMRDVQTGRTFDGTAVNGSLSWQPGINALSGQAATADGRLSGAAQGQFYGPSAQEVGGTFALRSPSTVTGAAASALVGAFGAKR
jgi:hypothetical protein